MNKLICFLILILMASPAMATVAAPPTLCTSWTVVDGETITCNGAKNRIKLAGVKALSNIKNQKATTQAAAYHIDVNTVVMLGRASVRALNRYLADCLYLTLHYPVAGLNPPEAFVYCDNNTFINDMLLQQGYADMPATKPEILQGSYVSAVQSNKGAWGFLTPSNIPPSISVSVNPTTGVAPLTATFAITSSDSDGTIAKVECDLDGDGTFEADVTGQSSVNHTYNTAGTYNVKCRATDNLSLASESNALTVVVSEPQVKVGDVIKTIPFPTDITMVGDIVFDKNTNSFWITAVNLTPLRLIQIDSANGTVTKTILSNNLPAYLNSSSEMAFDGQSFYFTSYGSCSGSCTGLNANGSFIYKVDMSGNLINTFPCPATSTGVYCHGLAWDGQYLWSEASDKKNLVQFSTDGIVFSTLSNVFHTVSLEDISFDSTANQLIVIKDGVNRVNKTTGNIDSHNNASYSKGDYDGQLYWIANNGTQQLEGIYIGN